MKFTEKECDVWYKNYYMFNINKDPRRNMMIKESNVVFDVLRKQCDKNPKTINLNENKPIHTLPADNMEVLFKEVKKQQLGEKRTKMMKIHNNFWNGVQIDHEDIDTFTRITFGDMNGTIGSMRGMAEFFIDYDNIDDIEITFTMSRGYIRPHDAYDERKHFMPNEYTLILNTFESPELYFAFKDGENMTANQMYNLISRQETRDVIRLFMYGIKEMTTKGTYLNDKIKKYIESNKHLSGILKKLKSVSKMNYLLDLQIGLKTFDNEDLYEKHHRSVLLFYDQFKAIVKGMNTDDVLSTVAKNKPNFYKITHSKINEAPF